MNRMLMERFILAFSLLFFASVLGRVYGDQVEMINGDRYVGKVMSLDSNTLVFQNEILGTVRLPRSKMAGVMFGAGTATNAVHAARAATSVSGTNSITGLQQTTTNGNAVQDVMNQMLGSEGAEAKKMYREMVDGVLSGKLTVDDIRAKAKMAADEIRKYKADLEGDDGGLLDKYLSILDAFVKEGDSPKTEAPKTQVK